MFGWFKDKDLDILKGITRYVNMHIEYVPDKKDHWQTPFETFKRKKGDCEDMAFYKQEIIALSEVMSVKQNKVIICKMYQDPDFVHAVNKVTTQKGKTYILDNLTHDVKTYFEWSKDFYEMKEIDLNDKKN